MGKADDQLRRRIMDDVRISREDETPILVDGNGEERY